MNESKAEDLQNQEIRVREQLEKQQYGLVGKHSSCKICTYTKRSIKNEDVCYKEQFYGIRCHLCCQMTPIMVCNNRCVICWRDTSAHTSIKIDGEVDDPKLIIDGCIKAQKKLLSGLGGYDGTNMDKLKEAALPKHFAISLTGEPTLYPKLGELIKEIHGTGATSFLVTNGLQPEVLERLEKEEALPTQLYVSVDAPNEELFKKIDNPLLKDGWQRLQKTLSLLPRWREKARTSLRFTIIKGMNDILPEQWAEIIKLAQPLFVEVKSYMAVGYSRERLGMDYMPRHHEVVEFSKKICEFSGDDEKSRYKIIDEKEGSRVVLLMKEDFDGRIMKFD
ncbi:4-demethylwyosine synthase TYW1 [Candidatus Woesearchaeota archaeon]|nr:4-demethylwyosine synthase TYW1 [Candidatus Woesearchaeota archaeon]